MTSGNAEAPAFGPGPPQSFPAITPELCSGRVALGDYPGRCRSPCVRCRFCRSDSPLRRFLREGKPVNGATIAPETKERKRSQYSRLSRLGNERLQAVHAAEGPLQSLPVPLTEADAPSTRYTCWRDATCRQLLDMHLRRGGSLV